MFIKASSFKKMIKQAAGSGQGLHIKNDGEAIWLTARRWKIWIPKCKIPNQQLGDLIALCGWLPADGEAVTVNKTGDQQVGMFETVAESAKDHWYKTQTKFYVTKHMVYDNGWVRILQSGNYVGQRPMCVDEDLFGVINHGAIDPDKGETLPEGPMVNIENRYEDGICFKNSDMVLMLVPHITNLMGREIEHMNKQRMLRWNEETINNTAEG